MTSDIEQRAIRLIEREDQDAARQQEQHDQEAHESRLKSAIEKVREQDRRAERERRRAEALDRAERLEPEIVQKRRETDDALASLMRALNELDDLEERYRALLKAAGESVPEPISRELTWWLHSHLRDLTELDREQKAEVILRGEPSPFSLTGGTD